MGDKINREVEEEIFVPSYCNRPGYLKCETCGRYYNGLNKAACPICSIDYKTKTQEEIKKIKDEEHENRKAAYQRNSG